MILLSKVFKSSYITVDADKCVKINVEPAYTPPVIQEGKADGIMLDELVENPEELVENARRDARRVIEQAKKQADDILNKARQKAEDEILKIKEEAKKHGYDDGYGAGAKDADDIRVEAEEIRQEAYIFKDELIKEAEPQVVEMIVSLMEKLLTAEVNVNPQVISILAKQGLREATMTGDITVHVSKEDYPTVMEAREDILSSFETMARIDFAEDVSLKKSDCIIETALGSINCGLKGQFKELKKNIYYLLNVR
jgi:flagellar assembly protein FliH